MRRVRRSRKLLCASCFYNNSAASWGFHITGWRLLPLPARQGTVAASVPRLSLKGDSKAVDNRPGRQAIVDKLPGQTLGSAAMRMAPQHIAA